MREVKITVWENGGKQIDENGTETIEMIEEVSEKEFSKRFQDVSTYGTDISTVFLENGMVLRTNEWNGECFFTEDSDGRRCQVYPVYEQTDEDGEDFDYAGYYIA